jgi:hypothetical protein
MDKVNKKTQATKTTNALHTKWKFWKETKYSGTPI